MRVLFRPAAIDDAPLLAELVNYAGEGLPLYLWGKLAELGQDAWDVGRARAAREEGAFSYRNATMIEQDGGAAGCLIGYDISDAPEPVPDDIPAMFRPLQELENLAAGTWYINVLAVRPNLRNRGLGARLLSLAEETARARGRRGLSLIVSDANAGARRLYERNGYRTGAARAMIKEGWVNAGVNWVLLTKSM